MPEQPKTFYLTTPIYYVNARPHIGHAYTTIVADVLARRHRLLGEDTFFLTGTDEHGQKIERSAAAKGMPPQAFADQVSASFRALWDRMGITYDDYIRTTEPRHVRGAQKLFSKLYENDFIELKAYTGSYCVSDEAFVDAPVGTPCPDCGRLLEEVTEENFFFKLSKFQEKLIDLIEGGELLISPDSARNEVLTFLSGISRSSLPVDDPDLATQDSLKGLGQNVKLSVFKNLESSGDLQRTENGHYFKPGALKDLSISRSSFTWGIPVPEPAASESQQKHVIYVWLDALANYITALGYGSDDESNFEKFWPADLHLVGKEITRFHCVYWPAFLMAAGLPTPKTVTANGWLLFDNAKMSKSRGNVVRTETILEGFGEHVYAKQFPESTKHERDLFASDVLRYHLLREIPFGQDGSFSFEAMITRYNADLANGYGNLVSRTLKMVEQYFAGALPSDAWLLKETSPIVESLKSDISISYEPSALTKTTAILASYVTALDVHLSESAPWKLAKSDDANAQADLKSVLYKTVEAIRIITALLYPILPYATGRVWAQLGLGDIEEALHPVARQKNAGVLRFAQDDGEKQTTAEGQVAEAQVAEGQASASPLAAADAGAFDRSAARHILQWGGLKPGTRLGPLAPIFPRADKGLAQIMMDMEEPTPAPVTETPATAHPAAGPRTASLDGPGGTLPVAGSTAHTTGPDPSLPPPVPAAEMPAGPVDGSPQIGIEDFAKVELRVAQVLVCERIPKADKLLRLEVDLGYERRQILSGIAEWYAPEELVGRRIVVITNLAPRKMRGLESHGMLLAASEEGGKPFLATVPEGVAVGTRLK